MDIYLYVEEDGQISGWSSSHDLGTKSISINQEHPFFNEPMSYKLVEDKLIKNDDFVLNEVKNQKDFELNQACNESILAGFTYTINDETYWFSYDMEAQGNFRDGREVLKDGLIDALPWTVRVGGPDGPHARILVDLEIMLELSVVAMMHKTEKISKYRDFLMPIVKGATTIEEVESIKW